MDLVRQLEPHPAINLEIARIRPAKAKLASRLRSELPDDLVEFFTEIRYVYIRWSAWSDPRIRGELFLQSPDKKSAGLYSLGDVSFRVRDGRLLYNAPVRESGETKSRKRTLPLADSWTDYLELALRARVLRGWECAYLGVHDGRPMAPSREGEFRALAPTLFKGFEPKRFGLTTKIRAMRRPSVPEACDANLSPETAGLSYRARLQGMIKKLELADVSIAVAQLGDPISEEDIDAVHRTLGYELAPAFLNYFRSVDGIRLVVSHKRGLDRKKAHATFIKTMDSKRTWHQDHIIWIPPLREIVTQHAVGELYRESFYAFDYIQTRQRDVHAVVIDLSKGKRDPILSMGNDHFAALCDTKRVLARSYFELLIQTMARTAPRYDMFKNMGYAKKHPIYRKTPVQIFKQWTFWLDRLFPFPGPLQWERSEGSVLSGEEYGGQYQSDF